MTIEKYEIKNRWTGAVMATVDISITPDTLPSAKLGLAVKWAAKKKADLHGADLHGADLHSADLHGANLRGADLRDADLRDADLHGADLRDANLRGADLRSFRADLWFILSMARAEVPAMADALRNGRVDGSTYDGECSCLVGTLEHAGATRLPRASSSPAEQWFSMICEGDKPGDDSVGGFAAKQALEWVEEYCAATDIVLA